MRPLIRSLLNLALLAAIAGTFTTTAQADDDKPASKEPQLIETLRTAPAADKALACKQLAIHGTKQAVPELAKLLSDEQLASWARIALEAIPNPAADEALRTAAKALKGKLLVGTINSIGVRRDAQAVEQLAGLLKSNDNDAAAAAALALGRIGNDAATSTLRKSLAAAGPTLAAVSEGCILCAERLMANGKADDAAAIYDEVRKADVPKQRKLEATRGAILARGAAGVPLLVEQLKSDDRALYRLGLSTARELTGKGVFDAVAKELPNASPERAALLLLALADRSDAVVSPAILAAAKNGDRQVRIAAISVVGRSGDKSSVGTLLEVATADDAELAQAATAALAALPGKEVNGEIAARLAKADGKALLVLINLAGGRRIDAAPALIEMLNHKDAAVRKAALTALGETIGQGQLTVLVSQAVAPKQTEDAEVALKALRAAAVRMPDRDACAAVLAAAMQTAPAAARPNLLEILGAVGGAKSLATIATAIRGNDEALQDTGSRLLGEWMSVDAAPVLLDLAKSASSDKHQVRAMRGYIRLARQFAMPEADRAKMCQTALDVATRPDEQKLVLTILEKYPSVDSLKLAVKASELPGLKPDASRVALAIGQKIGSKSDEAKQLLAKIGFEPAKIEIIKAEYGAGATRKDVTETLRKQLQDLPLVSLPKATYNESFGGDPVPGTTKDLRIQYTINGKPGEAVFAENAAIVLPMPK